MKWDVCTQCSSGMVCVRGWASKFHLVLGLVVLLSEDTSAHWSLQWNMSTLTFRTHSASPTLHTVKLWLLGSFRNGKYVENNSGQERTKSRTLPVTDKDLASTYVLCRLSPTCPWFWMERNYFWSEVRKEGKTKLRFKTDYDKTSTQCLNKKSWNIRVCNMAMSTW